MKEYYKINRLDKTVNLQYLLLLVWLNLFSPIQNVAYGESLFNARNKFSELIANKKFSLVLLKNARLKKDTEH